MDPTTQCTTSTLEWAGLIITIISMNVSWWLFDIPLLWKHGIKQYIYSVTWQCFRLYMPSMAAIYAISMAGSPEENASIYYTGPFHEGPDSATPSSNAEHKTSRGLTRFQFTKALVIDSLSVVSAGLSINNAIHTSAGAELSGFNSSLWSYPSLPVAAIGLWLLFSSKLRWSRAWTVWLGLLFVVAVGAALALPLALRSPAAKAGNLWIAAVICYVYMGLPVAALGGAALTLLCIALALLIRVGGITAGALSTMAYFPFCQLKNEAFGVIYLVVGCIGAVLALIGRIWFSRVELRNGARSHTEEAVGWAGYRRRKQARATLGVEVPLASSDMASTGRTKPQAFSHGGGRAQLTL